MFNRLKRRMQENKDAKMFDAVTEELANQTQYPNVSPITRLPSEQPLKDVHPELDLVLAYAQPGTLLEKAFAPSAIKGMVSRVANGEGAMAIMPVFNEWTGLELPELTKYHIGFNGAKPIVEEFKEPIRKIKSLSNYERFMQLSSSDKNNIVSRWNGIPTTYGSLDKKDLSKFFEWLNTRNSGIFE